MIKKYITFSSHLITVEFLFFTWVFQIITSKKEKGKSDISNGYEIIQASKTNGQRYRREIRKLLLVWSDGIL